MEGLSELSWAGQGGDVRPAPPWRPPRHATPFFPQVPRLLAGVVRQLRRPDIKLQELSHVNIILPVVIV